jgi:hypothetical protein
MTAAEWTAIVLFLLVLFAVLLAALAVLGTT